jgi:molybdate transport system substrate-binding protein
MRLALAALLLTGCTKLAAAPELDAKPPSPLSIAVDEELRPIVEQVLRAYPSKDPVKITYGIAGRLAQQLEDGTDFDLLVASAGLRPDAVLASGRCDATTFATLATDRLVVWSGSRPAPRELAELKDSRFQKIAIVDPEISPFGVEAQGAMNAIALLEAVKPKLVLATSARKALDLVKTGQADVAIVPKSTAVEGRTLAIDPRLHGELADWVVACGAGFSKPSARRFAAYLGTEQARSIFRRVGLDAPKDQARL